jgi:hypothetical protein
VALKIVGGKSGGWFGEELLGLLGSAALVCVVVESACVRDCNGLGLCTVGTVG